MLFMYILQTDYFNALIKRNRNFAYKAYRTLKDAVSKLKGNESDGTAKILKQWEKGIDTRRYIGENPVGENGGEQYEIVTLDTGKKYIEATRKVITGDSVREQRKSITKFFNEMLKNGSVEIQTEDGETLLITKDTAKKARDNYEVKNGKRVKMPDDLFLVKLHSESHIDEITKVSEKMSKTVVKDKKTHSFAKDGFIYRTVIFKDFDNKYYRIQFSTGQSNGVTTVYNIGKIKTDESPTGKIISRSGLNNPIASSSVNDTVSQSNVIVNRENSGNTENLTVYQDKDTENYPLGNKIQDINSILAFNFGKGGE